MSRILTDKDGSEFSVKRLELVPYNDQSAGDVVSYPGKKIITPTYYQDIGDSLLLHIGINFYYEIAVTNVKIKNEFIKSGTLNYQGVSGDIKVLDGVANLVGDTPIYSPHLLRLDLHIDKRILDENIGEIFYEVDYLGFKVDNITKKMDPDTYIGLVHGFRDKENGFTKSSLDIVPTSQIQDSRPLFRLEDHLIRHTLPSMRTYIFFGNDSFTFDINTRIKVAVQLIVGGWPVLIGKYIKKFQYKTKNKVANLTYIDFLNKKEIQFNGHDFVRVYPTFFYNMKPDKYYFKIHYSSIAI